MHANSPPDHGLETGPEADRQEEAEKAEEEQKTVAEGKTSVQALLERHRQRFEQHLIRSAMEPPRSREHSKERPGLTLLAPDGGSYFLQNHSELVEEHKKSLLELRSKLLSQSGDDGLWASANGNRHEQAQK